MSVMSLREFGDPVLRAPARRLKVAEIKMATTQKLIKDMREFLLTKKLGIGLAAPQIGQGVAVAVIAIRPTKHRPKVKPFDLVLINPEITEVIGKSAVMWEGCLSAGKGGLFAKTPRYKKVRAKYLDEQGKTHETLFSGLQAQVVQHETDHLNGILFVDHVRDTKSYMTLKEYKKRIAAKRLSTTTPKKTL